MLHVWSPSPSCSAVRSSQYMRSWLSQEKSVDSATPSFTMAATTSRAWTSITTSADSVLRLSFDRLPRTRLTMSDSCDVFSFSKSASLPDSIASTQPDVQ